MREIPAIIHRAVDTASDRERRELAVSVAFSALREAEVQETKAAERAEKARAVTQRRRLELGRALAEARKAWPARGPKARAWGEFLERQGIEQSVAYRLMQLAGYVEEQEVSCPTDDGHEIPTRREVNAARAQARSEEQPNSDAPVTSEPAVLGFDPDDVQPAMPSPAVGAPSIDLRLGSWQDALADVRVVDAVICDPPYSDATHAGSKGTRADGVSADGLAPSYDHWTAADVHAFVAAWAPRCRGWMVALTDSWLLEAWHAAYRAAGRYAFAPVPCVITGMTVRTRGDGPSSWAVYAMVSRPAALVGWGTLPGAYVGPAQPGAGGGRGKPLWLMEQLVRDYTRENDLVCDPLAGYASTLIAAVATKRRAVGAEVDPAAHTEARARAMEASRRGA